MRVLSLALLFIVFSVSTNGQNVGVDIASPVQKLDVAGGIRLGSTTNGVAGSMRWTGTNFQVHDGTQWITFGSGTDHDWMVSGVNMYSEVAGNVGIGTTAPATKLHVVGTARVSALNVNGIYSLPTVDGSAGYVLTTNGSGTVTWTNPSLVGDITAVIAGNGLVNGGTSGDVTLDVNPGDGIQLVSDAVAVRASDLEGNGLSVSSNNFNVNVDGSTIEINSDALRVKANGITSNEIAPGAVTTAEILNGTILSQDISTGGVTSANILDGTIVTADIATGGVTSTNILDGTIVTGDIATGGVTSTNILDGTIVSGDIATGGVNSTNILNGTILPVDISSPGSPNLVLSTNSSSVVGWNNPASLTTSLKDRDVDTGIDVDDGGTPDDDRIRMTTRGTERMRIDESGNVGVGTGTQAIANKLHVEVSQSSGQSFPLLLRNSGAGNTGSSGVGIGFNAHNTGAAPKSAIYNERLGDFGVPGKMHFMMSNSSDATAATLSDARLTIQSNGNVGIGTTVPGQRLDVNGNARMLGGGEVQLQTTAANVRGQLQAIEGGQNGGAGGGAGLIIATSGGENIAFKDGGLSGQENMTIMGTGNVGIGATAPSARLHTTGTVRFQNYTNGLVGVDASGNLLTRSITTSGTGISVANGNTVSGNPTFSLDYGSSSTGGTYPQGNFGQFQVHSTYSDFNSDPAFWGWNYVQGTGNAPNATSSQWYRGVFSLGSQYPARGSGGYSLELAYPRYNHGSAGIWMRTVENGAIGGWTRIDANGIGVSGTTNYVSKFTSGTTVGNSQIYDNGSNVGVSNTSPTRPLSFANTVGEKIALYAQSASARDYYGFAIEGSTLAYQVPTSQRHVWYEGGSERMRLVGSNLGIGTTGPAQKLDVNGGIRSTAYHYINHSSPSIVFQDTDERAGVIHVNSNRMYFLSGNGVNGTSWTVNGSYWPLYFDLNTDAATFGGPAYFMEGSVGIGTSSPSEALDVNGYVALQGKQALRGNDSWLRLNQANHFGSGTYTPYLMRADGGFDVDGNQVIDNNAGWHRSYGSTGWYNGSYGGGWYMTDATYIRGYNSKTIYNVDSDFPAAIFEENNSGYYALELYSANDYSNPGLYIAGYGYAYDWYWYSSRELKKDIRYLTNEDYESALSFVTNDLDFVYYRHKRDEGKIELGLIAEETPEVLVAPGRKGVDYAKISTFNAGAIKAINGKLEALTEKVERGTSQNEQVTINDFSTEQMSASEVWVSFNSDFSESLTKNSGTRLPVVTVTPHSQNVTLSIKEKRADGFMVSCSECVGETISFDWIAMARINTNPKRVTPQSANYTNEFKQMLEESKVYIENAPVPTLVGQDKNNLPSPEVGNPAEEVLKK